MDTERTAWWWGVGLIAVGVVLLLNQLDAWPRDVSAGPIVLVVLGLALASAAWRRRGKGGWVLPLVFLALGGWLLLEDLDVVRSDIGPGPIILIAIGLGLVVPMFLESSSQPAESRTLNVPLESTEKARVRIEHGAGELSIDSLDFGSLDLLQGTFDGGVDERVRRTGSEAVLTLRPPSGWGPLVVGRRLDWAMSLNSSVPFELEIAGGASNTRLDLSHLIVASISIEGGAAKTRLRVPSAGQCNVTVKAGAAAVEIEVPQGVSARIRSSAGLSKVEVDAARFPRSDDEWRSPDYEAAMNRADITIEGGVGSFTVR